MSSESPRPPRVAETAMARLVSAVVGPDDEFEGDCSVAAVLERLSKQDQMVLTNIAHRIAVVEGAQGAARAEEALSDIVALLARDRAIHA